MSDVHPKFAIFSLQDSLDLHNLHYRLTTKSLTQGNAIVERGRRHEVWFQICRTAPQLPLQVCRSWQRCSGLSEKSCTVHLLYLSTMLSGWCKTVGCGMNDLYRCVCALHSSVVVAFCTKRVSEHREGCTDAKRRKRWMQLKRLRSIKLRQLQVRRLFQRFANHV